MRWLTVSLLVFCSRLLNFVAGPQDEAPNRVVEPPRRLKITIGDESIIVAVGGKAAKLADGRILQVEAMPTRVFTQPGPISFEYPEGWRHSGSIGVPTATDGWWDLGGARSTVSLRRHGEDALSIRDTYAANMAKAGPGERKPCSLLLDGRKLEGHAVSYVQGGMHGYPDQDATQYVFGWKEREGVSWLIVFHRYEARGAEEILENQEISIGESSAQAKDKAGTDLRDLATETRESLDRDPELRVVLDSFRWKR